MKTQIQKQYRTAAIVSGSINSEERTVDISFSSEVPVERWFGKEILDHSKASADLSRLNNKAAVLEDHQMGQVGVVEKAEIKNKKGWARLRFSKRGKGDDIFEDIKDGIRTLVSFGYDMFKLELDSENDGEKTYRSKSWMPLEISMVGVPADHTVGVGRDKDHTVECEVPDGFAGKRDKEIEKTEKEQELIDKDYQAKKRKRKRDKAMLNQY